MFDDQLPPVAEPTETIDRRALYLRWRPRRFEDVVGQEHVTRTLRNAVKLGRPSHAYLFTGPRGTGKTSAARILFRAVNCPNADDGDPCNTCALCVAALENRALDLVEIDAASSGGVGDIRDLREKIAYRPNEATYRVYIVDEAHELSNQAWDAFLKTLEEPPPHAIFILATTEAHKVPPTIVSRCQRFDFRRIPYQATRDQLARVAASEGIAIEQPVLQRLALVARGGLRDALSLLDQLAAFAGGPVDMAVARAALSLPSIEAVQGVIDGMTQRDPSAVMTLLSDAAEGGADLRLFAEELVVHLRALLLLRTGADARLTDELPEDEVAWLRARAQSWSVGTLMRLIQTLSDALARTRDAAQFQIHTEVALLIACDAERIAPLSLPQESAPQRVPPESAPARVVVPPTPEPPVMDTAAPQAAPAPPVPAPPVPPPPVPAPPPTPEAQLEPADQAAVADGTLKSRWTDVIEHVKSRNPILASLLGSAHPLGVQENQLVVAFGTEFNRKSAEKATHRQIIETAFARVYGTPYGLRCTVGTGTPGATNLLDDPVINYAARTFGGQPRRVPTEQAP
jgi:DNA polymerase-3 subunit gamma/tau